MTIGRRTSDCGRAPGHLAHLHRRAASPAIRWVRRARTGGRSRHVLPTDASGEAYALLATARATPHETIPGGDTSLIVGLIPSAEVHRFEQHLPGIGRGEAVFTSTHEGYQPVRGDQSTRTAAAPRGRGSAGGRGFEPDRHG